MSGDSERLAAISAPAFLVGDRRAAATTAHRKREVSQSSLPVASDLEEKLGEAMKLENDTRAEERRAFQVRSKPCEGLRHEPRQIENRL